MPVTIKTIAERVGVHHSAVSRALNGKGQQVGLSTKRIDQIRSVADDLGYRPSATGRAMQRGRTGVIALVVGSLQRHTEYHDALLDGIQDACEPRDAHLLLARLSDQLLDDGARLPKTLRELSADGLLFKWFPGTSDRLKRVVDEQRLPVIWLSRKWDYDCVYNDEVEVGRRATQLLIETGHRHIAYFSRIRGGGLDHHFAADRESGYRTAMTEAGLTPHVVEPPAEPLVAAALGPCSATVANLADAAIEVAMANATAGVGIATHDEAGHALVAMDNKPVRIGSRSVPTVCPDARGLGAAGVDMLIRKLAKPNQRLASRAIGCRLTNGAAAAPRALSIPPERRS
ncbi:MAG: LacI family DNA-binding transcriptional regulator [Planctomycetota bacterium]